MSELYQQDEIFDMPDKTPDGPEFLRCGECDYYKPYADHDGLCELKVGEALQNPVRYSNKTVRQLGVHIDHNCKLWLHDGLSIKHFD